LTPKPHFGNYVNVTTVLYFIIILKGTNGKKKKKKIDRKIKKFILII